MSKTPIDMVGIDVSHHQDEIIWSSVKDHVKYCFIRITNGIETDTRAHFNIEKSKGLMPRGYYHFYQNWLDPDRQAQKFLEIAADVNGIFDNELPLVVDVEQYYTNLNNVKRFIDVVEDKANQKLMIYTRTNIWATGHGDRNIIGNQHLWIARYPFRDSYWDEDNEWETTLPKFEDLDPGMPPEAEDWLFWQVTDKARRYDFLEANHPANTLDINLFNGTPQQFNDLFGAEDEIETPEDELHTDTQGESVSNVDVQEALRLVDEIDDRLIDLENVLKGQ